MASESVVYRNPIFQISPSDERENTGQHKDKHKVCKQENVGKQGKERDSGEHQDTAGEERDTGGCDSLHDAVRDNNFEAVKTYLKRYGRAGIDATDEQEFAPIHYAAKFNCFRILKLLEECGANVNLKTKGEGLTPLHLAARYQPHSSIDIDFPVRRPSITSMSDAKLEQLSSSKNAVKFLRKKVADVNMPDKYGNTPLHMACQRGNVDAVEDLIKCKDIILTARNRNEGNTPIHEACLYGKSTILEKLLEKLNPVSTHTRQCVDWVLANKAKHSPLHLACREGHYDIVKLLLKHVPSNQKKRLLQAEDNEQNTALHLACQNGNPEVVRFLLTNEADPCAVQNPKRITPLHVAASLGHLRVVKALLEKDFTLMEAKDKFRQTPVHYAVLANDHDVLEAFKECLDDNEIPVIDHLNTPDKEHRTPLLLAAMLGKDAAFQMLLEVLPEDCHNALDTERKSVLSLAADKRIFASFTKSPDVYKKLVAAPDANLNTPLHIAAESGNAEIVKYLLNEPNDIAKKNARNAGYRTPLHLAAKNGHIEVVRLLVTANSHCAVEDENGDTPLHLACAMGHTGVVYVLHSKRVNADARNRKDYTSLHCAAIGGHDTLVEILIADFNAEVDPLDRNHFTPLLLAAKAGHLNVVKRLLEHDAQVLMTFKEHRFNALDSAIDYGHEDVALVIVKSTQWEKALKYTTTLPDKNVWGQTAHTTPLRKLIKAMPKVAKVVFDKCTTLGNTDSRSRGTTDSDSYGNADMESHGRNYSDLHTDSKSFTVTFNYEFIEDFRDPEYDVRASPFRASLFNLLSLSTEKGHRSPWGPENFSMANHPLTMMLENERTELLTHPLVTSLLRYKWRKYGRYTYWMDLFLYMLFVIFLTAFALVLPNPESETCQRVFNGTLGNLSVGNCTLDNLLTPKCGELKCGLNKVERIFIIVAGVCIAVYSIISLFFHLFLYIRLFQTYVKDWATVFNFFSSVTTIIFVVVHFTTCFCPYNWQWQLGTVAVFLAWVNFSVSFRKLPLTGIYVLMFVKVFYTFCKVIVLSFLLVIAFSLGFYMAFHQPLTMAASRSPFSSPARSIVKTLTMIVGEFDYEDIFHLSSLQPDIMLEEIPFFQVANLLWIIFLVVAPILFLNLLTGLAVDDIKRIQEDAAIKRLELQIRAVLTIEAAVPVKFRNRFMITKDCTLTPNEGFHITEKLRHNVWEEECYDTIISISKALELQLRNREGTTEQSRQCGHADSLVEDVASIKRTVHELKSLVEALTLKGDSDPKTPALKRNVTEKQFLHIHHSTSYTSDPGDDFFDDQPPAQKLF